MNRFSAPLVVVLTIFTSGCISLSYPEAESPALTVEEDSEGASEPNWADPSGASATDNPSSAQQAIASARAEEDASRTELVWSDLLRQARQHQRLREYDEASQKLSEANALVSNLAASHTRRRTVFSARARLANLLARQGEIEKSDALTDELIGEAEREPNIAGPALVTLATSTAKRRTQDALSAAQELDQDAERDFAPQLPLLAVALHAAQEESASRDRLSLASLVSQAAFHEKDFSLARQGIDQAILDFDTLASTDNLEFATMLLQRARIAIGQGDFRRADDDATRANQLFDRHDATNGLRGYGEATLAEALVGLGDFENASAISRAAVLRIDTASDSRVDPARESGGDGTEAEADAQITGAPIDAHTQRIILAAGARVEAAQGSVEAATSLYDRALDLPEEESKRDRGLVADLVIERSALAGVDRVIETPSND